jgi:hypothetical protein
MKTLRVISFALIVLGAAPPVIAAGVVCTAPDGTEHENPALCAQRAGEIFGQPFKAPGQATKWFTDNLLPDPEYADMSRNGERITPADIMRGAKRTGGACDTPAPGGL